MKSLKEKYKRPEPFMKWLRKTRNKISKKINNMSSEEVSKYFKDGAEKCKKRSEEVEKQDIYASIIVNDFIIREALIMFKNKFDSFQWVWDHQEDVYNATRGKNWNELIDYFESIYQYIQNN